jgi:hypothetical protein
MFHQKEFIMLNKKWLPHIITVAAVLLFAFLGLASGSSPSSSSSGSSSSSSGSSSSSSSGTVYTFVNNSSHTVYVDGTPIPAGQQQQLKTNGGATWVMNMRYTPDDLVACSGLIGTSITFYDK